LYPRKGSIMSGADADLALWDADCEVVIQNNNLHHNVDYTPYQGMTVKGWPIMTFSRGRLVSENFRFVGVEGSGEFMACGKPLI